MRATTVPEFTQVLDKLVPALGHNFCSLEPCGEEPGPPTMLAGGRRCGSTGAGHLAQHKWGFQEGFPEERSMQENLVSHPVSIKQTQVSKLKRRRQGHNDMILNQGTPPLEKEHSISISAFIPTTSW